ncbi:MAG TPA: YrdB family protein [Nocardioidaceae bacterium]|nr:YrdB family protein [Nocardioidaceae bacterium]
MPADRRSLTGPWLVLAAVRFLAELGLIAALGYVGWRILDDQPAIALLVALVLAAAAATIWGAWVAPKSEHRLEDPARLAVEVALFAVACAALAVAGNGIAAIVLGLAYAVSAPVGRRGF